MVTLEDADGRTFQVTDLQYQRVYRHIQAFHKPKPAAKADKKQEK